MKRVLSFPAETKVEWKSHDTSIQQRTAIEELRRDKRGSKSSAQPPAAATGGDDTDGGRQHGAVGTS